MERIFEALSGKKNYVFVGEAGSGKSEVAMTFARKLVERSPLPVHFFDLDMTKPLFRSRDAAARLEAEGVAVHFMEQFMDAPTLVGGVSPLLGDPGCLTVLDVGGDYIGARSIGGFAPQRTGPTPRCYMWSTPSAPGRTPSTTSTRPWGRSLGCPTCGWSS